MNTYRIRINNESGYEVFNALFNANNENEALMQLLKETNTLIFCGDSIIIEEY